MSGFTDELRRNIVDNAEKRAMIEFILSELIVPINDMKRLKMMYKLIAPEDIEDLLNGYNSMSFGRNNANNVSESIDWLVISFQVFPR